MCVIDVLTCTIKCVVPADPANPSSFKQRIEGMYDKDLKQGSKIVDGLWSDKQPVFVYIVPNGELLGGAWVVLDSSINSEQMRCILLSMLGLVFLSRRALSRSRCVVTRS